MLTWIPNQNPDSPNIRKLNRQNMLHWKLIHLSKYTVD